MGEKPATDPVKPGSKLAEVRALGRRGGIRPAAEEGSPAHADRTREPGPVTVTGPDPAPVKRAIVRAGKAVVKAHRSGETADVETARKSLGNAVKKLKPKRGRVKPVAKKTVEKAKRVLKGAETKARKKSGPPKGSGAVGEPWKALGVSKAKYYRDLKAGGGQ